MDFTITNTDHFLWFTGVQAVFVVMLGVALWIRQNQTGRDAVERAREVGAEAGAIAAQKVLSDVVGAAIADIERVADSAIRRIDDKNRAMKRVTDLWLTDREESAVEIRTLGEHVARLDADIREVSRTVHSKLRASTVPP